MNEPNPTVALEKPVESRRRIPMSVPQRQLEVDPIPGFNLHWFREDQIHRALQGGYEFVLPEEATLNQRGVATSGDISGNTDLGSRVSVIDPSGKSPTGGAARLYLMKIKSEWYEEDQKLLADRNAQVRDIINSTLGPKDKGESNADYRLRYGSADLQTPKRAAKVNRSRFVNR
jgi:hypothetical protein